MMEKPTQQKTLNKQRSKANEFVMKKKKAKHAGISVYRQVKKDDICCTKRAHQKILHVQQTDKMLNYLSNGSSNVIIKK